MAVTPQTLEELARAEAQQPGWASVVRDFVRRRPLGAIGACIVLVMVFTAATAGILAPYDPLATDYASMLGAPDARHWLGTDAFGRDVLSRIIYGSRTALMVGLGAALLGGTLGSLIGVASAYFGGRVDLVVQRVMDVFFAFPVIILALAVVAILGTGAGNVILAIATPMVPRCARVVRAMSSTSDGRPRNIDCSNQIHCSRHSRSLFGTRTFAKFNLARLFGRYGPKALFLKSGCSGSEWPYPAEQGMPSACNAFRTALRGAPNSCGSNRIINR